MTEAYAVWSNEIYAPWGEPCLIGVFIGTEEDIDAIIEEWNLDGEAMRKRREELDRKWESGADMTDEEMDFVIDSDPTSYFASKTTYFTKEDLKD